MGVLEELKAITEKLQGLKGQAAGEAIDNLKTAVEATGLDSVITKLTPWLQDHGYTIRKGKPPVDKSARIAMQNAAKAWFTENAVNRTVDRKAFFAWCKEKGYPNGARCIGTPKILAYADDKKTKIKKGENFDGKP